MQQVYASHRLGYRQGVIPSELSTILKNLNCESDTRRALRSHDEGSRLDPDIADWKPPSADTEKDNTLEPINAINAIRDALASQQHGAMSLICTIEPDLIEEAMYALREYRKLFAPVIRGVTDTAPIYAAYERMRQGDTTQPTILLLVECQTKEEFSEALGRLPIRNSSEWRSLDAGVDWESVL